MVVVERAIVEVLQSRRIANADKIKAIEAGAKILAVRHKIEQGDTDESSFFNRRPAR